MKNQADLHIVQQGILRDVPFWGMDKVLAFGTFFLVAILVIAGGVLGYPIWGYICGFVCTLVMRFAGVRLWNADPYMIQVWFQYRYYCADTDGDGVMPSAVYPGAKLPRSHPGRT